MKQTGKRVPLSVFDFTINSTSFQEKTENKGDSKLDFPANEWLYAADRGRQADLTVNGSIKIL